MSRGRVLLLLFVAKSALVGLTLAVVGTPAIPLGLPGEWTWNRLRAGAGVDGPGLLLGLVAVLGYAAFAAAGIRAMRAGPSRGRTLAWLAALGPAAVLVQVAALTAAPAGYGLAKWTTLGMPGASGYLDLARDAVADRGAFWAAYPGWIAEQDALHVGTHPPGLILVADVVLSGFERRPEAARALNARLPAGLDAAFRAILGPRPHPERAAMVVLGLMTLLASALAAWPVFAMARPGGDLGAAWAAATLWPLVPAAVLFQPTADTAYPLLAALALALAMTPAAAGPIGRERLATAILAGAVLAVGMQFSLVFLAVGFVAFLVLVATPGRDRTRRLRAVLATGAGFLAVSGLLWAVSGANPLPIWLANARNHHRFYAEFPRSYWGWVALNPIETAVAIGLPVAALVGYAGARRRLPAVAVATLLTLALLTLTGRNLSEVARLWLPFFPALVVAAGRGLVAAGGGPKALAGTVLLLGIQTLGLQLLVQVVYPV
jgi:hypothetical protein